MKLSPKLTAAATLLAALLTAPHANAQAWNTYPLVFGMTPQQASDAMQSPLEYVRGRHGSEVFVTVRTVGVPSIYPTKERIFLQFRRGRLTGWKNDWRVVKGWL
ncbi:MAG TPA: hypothetical protein VM867_03990 [Xanthobacteraceae bacterium]|nr:hypothetical protein [Xanthobacteraceae bacterium]